MKRLVLFCLLVFTTMAYAQIDSIRAVEPAKETSYTNKDLLLISLAGLALLLAIYFLFRKTRGTRK